MTPNQATDSTKPSEREELIVELRQLLKYDPETGMFSWVVSPRNGVNVGDQAGSITSQGYVVITIGKKGYRAHILAWAFANSAWPMEQIDHINRNRADNRICNLREATLKQNNENISIRKDNTSGHRGVYWHRDVNKWAAAIAHNKKKVYLGAFESIDEACAAYAKAAAIYHTHNQEKAHG